MSFVHDLLITALILLVADYIEPKEDNKVEDDGNYQTL